eukprot:1690433-Pyramimonas_sp.AAC.1
MGDVNDGLGISKLNGEWQEVPSSALGPVRTRECHRHGAGESFREVLEEYGLFVPTTVRSWSPTFFGSAGGASMIDFVAIPME